MAGQQPSAPSNLSQSRQFSIPAIVGGTIAGVVSIILAIILYWRVKRARLSRARTFVRVKSWDIEDGHASSTRGALRPPLSLTTLTPLPDEIPTIVFSSPPQASAAQNVEKKTRKDNEAELIRRLEDVQDALRQSEAEITSPEARIDEQQENDTRVSALQEEINRLRTALDLANSSPPPAYDSEGRTTSPPSPRPRSESPMC
jgi:hypothetical protein